MFLHMMDREQSNAKQVYNTIQWNPNYLNQIVSQSVLLEGNTVCLQIVHLLLGNCPMSLDAW